MAASIEYGLERADRRGKGPVGVLGCPTLGSFLALESTIALSFPNRSESDNIELQSSLLGEIRRKVQGNIDDSV